MNELQESHLQSILDKVRSGIDFKYRKGQQEHGGNLWDRDVIQDAIDESIDQITYAYTIDYKRRQAISLIENAIIKLQGREEDSQDTILLLMDAVEQLTQKRTTI
jgi:hypothetical protein